VIESYVDLAYRGLSLGRRIRLAQVRPNTGFLELAAPMPVGTQVAITTDDGATFEATVVWVHEQVSGGERAPGMIVAPELGSAEITAWWTARVTAADDDPRSRSPSPGGRGRPVTVRPRSHTAPTPPPPGAVTAEAPAIAADLQARVAAAAGLARAPTTDDDAARTIIMPVMPAIDDPSHDAEASAAERPAGAPERSLQRTGEHDVIDDGKQTMIMQSVDAASLGLGDAAGGDLDEFEDGQDTDASDPDDRAPSSGEPTTVPDGAPLPPGRRRKKRTLRR
jgi:hypothetical protein